MGKEALEVQAQPKPPAPKKKPVERPKPAFDENMCVGCAVCLENCPRGCLDLKMPDGGVHAVAALTEESKCIGCGICYDVCPADAIELYLADGTRVERGASGEENLMANPAYKAFCRTFQGGMKVANYFLGYRTPKFISGPGCLSRLPGILKKGKIDHILLVTDEGLMKLGLPPFITATTGLDALCHAVEAYTNHTYNTKLENRFSKKAVKLIYRNLLTAYEDGSNKEARENMQKAAFFAGRAFTRGCVGYVHAIGHTLGGLYGVPHGLAMSIILPHVMRAFGPSVYPQLADLAEVCNIAGDTEQEKAENFIKWIEKMKKDMDIPVGLDMIKDEDVDQIITWAMKEANPLYPVPEIWGRKKFREVIESMRV